MKPASLLHKILCGHGLKNKHHHQTKKPPNPTPNGTSGLSGCNTSVMSNNNTHRCKICTSHSLKVDFFFLFVMVVAEKGFKSQFGREKSQSFIGWLKVTFI